ncbi:MAG: polysaccharide deacetylase family protein [Gemmatimonadaceae bacterium]
MYQPFWMIRGIQRALPDVVFWVDARDSVVALTLDDGPDDSVTPQVLALLRQERVRATWFVIGERVQQYPELLDAIRAGGHEVANHFWDETATWRLNRQRFRHEVLRTEALIHQQSPTRLLRPASGWFRGWARREAREMGFTLVLGSAYTSDPAKPPSTYMRWALTRMARPGTIIVLHVGRDRDRTATVLPDLIRGVRAKGLEFVTVSELLRRRMRSSSGPSDSP